MIFNLKNIYCKYKNSNNPVLHISDLKIDQGEIVFLIGASGVGKSTILETLGFMNNTVLSQKNSVFDFKFENSSENMLEFWSKNESKISDFRKKYLSFIFQNTNLFPNLNALDNVLITPLLQGDNLITTLNDSRKIFKKIFPKEYKEILNDKKITEMSGGQRQRLAFCRAIATHYKILLADEPTGNLDWANANNLMSHLIADIRNKKSTAIVVSHDIHLAVSHADKIVYIDKAKEENNNYFFGKISNENTFIKSEDNLWSSLELKNSSQKLNNELLVKYLQDDIINKNKI